MHQTLRKFKLLAKVLYNFIQSLITMVQGWPPDHVSIRTEHHTALRHLSELRADCVRVIVMCCAFLGFGYWNRVLCVMCSWYVTYYLCVSSRSSLIYCFENHMLESSQLLIACVYTIYSPVPLVHFSSLLCFPSSLSLSLFPPLHLSPFPCYLSSLIHSLFLSPFSISLSVPSSSAISLPRHPLMMFRLLCCHSKVVS